MQDPRVETVFLPSIRRGIILWQSVTQEIERELLFDGVVMPTNVRVDLQRTVRSFFARRIYFISDSTVENLKQYRVKMPLLSAIQSAKVGTDSIFYSLYIARALIRGMQFDPTRLPYSKPYDVDSKHPEPRRQHSLLLGILSLEPHAQAQTDKWFGSKDLAERNVAFQFLYWMQTQGDTMDVILKSIDEHWYQVRQQQTLNDLTFIHDLMIQAPNTADTLFRMFAEISMNLAPFPLNWLSLRTNTLQPLQLVI